jgi:hypothetical protein
MYAPSASMSFRIRMMKSDGSSPDLDVHTRGLSAGMRIQVSNGISRGLVWMLLNIIEPRFHGDFGLVIFSPICGRMCNLTPFVYQNRVLYL